MDFECFKQAVVGRCAQLGIEEYELYYSCAESTSVGAFQQEINQFTGTVAGGVCFRCIVGGKMGYASTEELSAEEAVAVVDRAADNAACLETEDPVFLGQGGQTYQELNLHPYALPTTEELIDKVLQTQKALYEASEKVVDGSTTQGVSERSSIAIYNSKGLDLSYVNQSAGLVCVAVVSDGAEMSNDVAIRLGELETIDHRALAAKAANGALEKMGGEAVTTGVYPVIFDPKAMSDLLNTFSGIFSSEAAQKGLSRLAGMEGNMVASEVVTIVDDPFHPENPMPIHFDAEGSPTYCKKIVDKGVLNTLLYNLKTAHKAGKMTTGNASKGDYNASVKVRPFTMYIEGGNQTEAELLSMAGNGVYITALEGLHSGANAVSGDFSLQSAGYLIENGKKTKRIKGFTVAGNFYELLKKIVAVADNTCLPRALGMTAFGAPSVLVESLSIAGE
jgi:PmbA protein